MIDKAIGAVVIGIMLIALSVQLLLTAIPLFRRMEFDAVCHAYVQVMDQGGGLSEDNRTRLIADLAARGFTVETLSGIWAGLYGDELSLIVKASFVSWQLGSDLTLKEVHRSFTYQANLLCRKMFDFGAVP